MGASRPALHQARRRTGPSLGRSRLAQPAVRTSHRPLALKLAAHGDGLALVFARTDTAWFQRIATEATALCFVGGRLRFHRPDGTPGATAPSPSLLVAFGLPCALGLAESGLGRTLIVPNVKSQS